MGYAASAGSVFITVLLPPGGIRKADEEEAGLGEGYWKIMHGCGRFEIYRPDSNYLNPEKDSAFLVTSEESFLSLPLLAFLRSPPCSLPRFVLIIVGPHAHPQAYCLGGILKEVNQSLPALPIDGLAFTRFAQRRLQYQLTSIQGAGLRSNDGGARSRLQQLHDVLAHGNLLRQREDVQEHGDVDHVPRAPGPGELVLVGEDVARDEVRRAQAVAVLEQRVPGVSEARKHVCAVEARQWRAAVGKCADILANAGSEIEELRRGARGAVVGGELLKDAGVVRVAEKPLLDEPEFAYAWPGEDLPGFLAL